MHRGTNFTSICDRMVAFHILLLLYGAVICVRSEVTVLRFVQMVYDTTPRIRIQGSGFNVPAEMINLDISFANSYLKGNKDYSVSLDENGDGLILQLLPGRRSVALVNFVFHAFISFNYFWLLQCTGG